MPYPRSSQNFYHALPASSLPLPELLREPNFHTVPDDWSVIIADVRNSTAAIAADRHNDVNLIAAGSLIAALNVARAHAVEVPFFFGGDGGTVLMPPSVVEEALRALEAHSRNTENKFGLAMHVGAVPVADITAAGCFIRVAKTRLGKGFFKAVLVGDGLLWAERQIKARTAEEDREAEEAAAKKTALNMMGLECRWDRIRPPQAAAEIVCYLIEACHPRQQLEVYRDVLLHTDKIFGTQERRNPLSADRLKLLLSTEKMRREMLARFGRWRWRYFAAEMVKTATARVLLKRGKKLADFDGKTYLDEVVSNADTLTIDGRINTIISGTPEQRRLFIEYLNAQETAGRLVYGHHVNRESVMTCYIQAREEKHVHFVDGSDGGYTAAAGELKRKLKASE